MLEGLPQQKDLSRVLYLPPPLGGHIRACVGWFVCCLALYAGMQGRPQVNTGAFVPVLFNGLYAQAFSHWVL